MRIKTDLLRFILAIATIASVGSSAMVCSAQEDLPSAEDVIAKYVETTGGIDKYKAIKSLHQQGTMSIPMAGVEGKIEIKLVTPNKLAINVDLGGAGNETSGSDGETVWSNSTMTGSRILSGKEAEQALLEADIRRIYDPASVYKSLETIGTEEVDNEKCYKLKVVRNSGDEQFEYYSVDSGLQKKTEMTAQTPMGPINLEVSVSDYKEVDGIMFPHKMTQTFVDQGMTMEMKMDKIALNPEFDDKTFALPESIQKLVDKKKEDSDDDDDDDDKDDDDDDDDNEDEKDDDDLEN